MMSKKQSTMIPVITIDGPSGVGKGTVCHQLAKILNWNFLDSGAIYRIVAYVAEQQKIAPEDDKNIVNIANTLDVHFDYKEGGKILYKTHDISQVIRTEECGGFASKIAQYPQVREALLARQRAFKKAPGLVTDGRDMGTVVFPDAILKFFLSASQPVRAKRRQLQLQKQGINVNLDQILADISARDERDQQRAVSPLRPADDAVYIDTSELSVAQVLEKVLEKVSERLIKSN